MTEVHLNSFRRLSKLVGLAGYGNGKPLPNDVCAVGVHSKHFSLIGCSRRSCGPEACSYESQSWSAPLRLAEWAGGAAGRYLGANSRELYLIYTPPDNAQYFMFRGNVGANSKHLSLIDCSQ